MKFINRYCLICYQDLYKDISINSFIKTKQSICSTCQNKFMIIDKKSKIDGVDITFLYSYNPFLKQIIYQYKGCYDIALKDLFLMPFKNEIRKKYKNYTILFPPSNEQDNIKRGYKHIEKMIECLNMPYIDIFYKNKNYKQSDQPFIKRNEIKNVIMMKNSKIDVAKKYLIIDDIFTSGSTIHRLIHLLLLTGIKKENIAVIIVAKSS